MRNLPKSIFCKSSGLVQELGNYLVAGRDLPPASLLLDEEVSVLGPAEQVWCNMECKILLIQIFVASRVYQSALAATFLPMVIPAGFKKTFRFL